MSTGLRGVEILDHVPAGCALMLVTSDYSSPHIRPGEFAVIDPNDIEPQLGEPYVRMLRGGDGELRPQIFVPRPHPRFPNDKLPEDDFFVSLCPMRGRGYADGPLSIANLSKIIVARVVGVYMAPEHPAALPSPGVPHHG